MRKKVRGLLFIIVGSTALLFLISALGGGRIREVPFALAVVVLALADLLRWSLPTRNIANIWLIAAALLATDSLTVGRVSFLFWIACIALVFFSLGHLVTWRSSMS